MFFIGRLLFVLLFAVCEVFVPLHPQSNMECPVTGINYIYVTGHFFVALWYRTFIENK